MALTENQKLWVAALRSGEYPQGRGRLQYGDTYCCLGVGTCVYMRETGKVLATNLKHVGLLVGELDKVRDWLGLSTDKGSYDCLHRDSLVFDNDSGKSFNEIADIIESEPAGLFTNQK